jgi:tetratricopeptide (TPR) repeat protein
VQSARYYLGKVWYERTWDIPATRIANLKTALTWFDRVLAAPADFHTGGAHYWRGRCHHALASEIGTVAAPDSAELAAALKELKLVAPPDLHADGALYYIAKAYVHLQPPLCTGGSDPAPASVCDALAALNKLVSSNALYAASTYPLKALVYVRANLASCSCQGVSLPPGETAFADALSAFESADLAMIDGLKLQRAGDLIGASPKLDAAIAGFRSARTQFDAFAAAFCSPDRSARCDHGGYLGGRSSFELGKLLKSAPEWRDAIARLEKMEAAYPASTFLPDATYFDGRSHFELKEWPLARAKLARAIEIAPNGVRADAAQEHIGTSYYEEGLALVSVTPRPTPGSANYAPALAAFDAAERELLKVLSGYPASRYLESARYYLGKTSYERPWDGSTTRIANLNTALTWFDRVLAAPAPTHTGGAHYWRGRCHYALASEIASPSAPDPAELAIALRELKVVLPPDAHADNALYYIAKVYVHTQPPICTGGSDPAPASICDAYATLKSLVASNGLYTASTYPLKTQNYVQAHLPSCACPW